MSCPHLSAININCVILNYNDASTVEKLVGLILPYRSVSRIVVVDNASTDDSFKRLNDFAAVCQNASGSDKIDVIRADHNGGYGAGNNLGVRYAVTHNHATHVLIANPDVSFDESCVLGLARVFQKHPETGIASALMEDSHYSGLKNGWKRHGFVGELLNMGPVSRRLFRPFLQYPASYFRGKKAVWVHAVHGSMLMVDAAAFLQCKGYDEGIFLYQEEAVLAQRMTGIGRRTVLLLTQSYRHQHSVSVSRSYEDELARQRLREQSVLYFMKHYLSVNPFQELLAKLWFWGIRQEVRLGRLAQAAILGRGR